MEPGAFKKRNINMTFFMSHYVHQNFLIRYHFDEITSESYSAGLCEHFNTKFEFFPCRITKMEFFETIYADLPEHAEQVVGSSFNRQIHNQRSRKPPGTKYQPEIWGLNSWVPPHTRFL